MSVVEGCNCGTFSKGKTLEKVIPYHHQSSCTSQGIKQNIVGLAISKGC